MEKRKYFKYKAKKKRLFQACNIKPTLSINEQLVVFGFPFLLIQCSTVKIHN